MWIKYNPNPTGRSVGDCAVRALSKALRIDWESAYTLASDAGYAMGDMPSADSVWGAVLRQAGFYRQAIPSSYPDDYTVRDFCRDHPRGTYVLGLGGHVVAIEDGDYYDSWDSGQETPVYTWYRKE